MEKNFKTGCIPNIYDSRDYKFNKHPLMTNYQEDLLDKEFDLRDEFMPEIFHQHHGSCTAQATVCSYWYQTNRLISLLGTKNKTEYSTRFVYLMTRYLHGNFKEDKGGSIRDACKAIKKYGIANTRNYPNEGDIFELPDFYTMVDAGREKAEAYYEISAKDYLIEILTCLDNKIPVIIGMDSDLISDARYSGYSRNSLSWNERHEANHAMLIVGRKINVDYFGEKRNVFIIRNSWGFNWGDEGYCYLPEDQMIKYGIDDCMVLFKREFEADDIDNDYKLTKYGKENSIPNNSLIYKDKGYSLDYFLELRKENFEEFNKLYIPILKDSQNAYVKDINGKLKNLYGKEIKIEFPIIYTDKYGQEFILK